MNPSKCLRNFSFQNTKAISDLSYCYGWKPAKEKKKSSHLSKVPGAFLGSTFAAVSLGGNKTCFSINESFVCWGCRFHHRWASELGHLIHVGSLRNLASRVTFQREAGLSRWERELLHASLWALPFHLHLFGPDAEEPHTLAASAAEMHHAAWIE